jgi:hypothetical protein
MERYNVVLDATSHKNGLLLAKQYSWQSLSGLMRFLIAKEMNQQQTTTNMVSPMVAQTPPSTPPKPLGYDPSSSSYTDTPEVRAIREKNMRDTRAAVSNNNENMTEQQQINQSHAMPLYTDVSAMLKKTIKS